MRFSKYHGLGNDFVMLADPADALRLTPEAVRALCDRRFGIGADGVIRVAPGHEGGDLFMDYVNSDGSIGEMCGNGIRCLAVFARAEGLTAERHLKVETRAGLKVVEVGEGDMVRVDMGAPIFRASDIPVDAERPLALDVTTSDGSSFTAACVSMGNPHAVITVPDPREIDLERVGREIESNPVFPNKTNVEFIRVLAPDHVEMRVWERGAGATLACGTGACAAAVIARLLHEGAEKQTVTLPGGDLEVEWRGSLDHESPVYMTGPVTHVYSGELAPGLLAEAQA